MLIGMAEYYSAELALKVARGERENALQCKYNGGMVPLGFTIGKEDRLYHIDPETAPIVQEIFSRYADGEPAEKIAASLNERGSAYPHREAVREGTASSRSSATAATSANTDTRTL